MASGPHLFTSEQERPGIVSIVQFGPADNSGSMLWFFEKQNSRLRYEIRRACDGPAFELVITHPDGREEVEKFSDPVDVLRRSEHLEHTLAAAGWRSPESKALTRLRM